MIAHCEIPYLRTKIIMILPSLCPYIGIFTVNRILTEVDIQKYFQVRDLCVKNDA